MKIYLVGILKEITNRLRVNEEEYMKKYVELVGSPNTNKYGNNAFNFNSSSNTGSSTSHKVGGVLENAENDLLRKRDVEINNLVNSITELAGIFKDLQSLVFEQGNKFH